VIEQAESRDLASLQTDLDRAAQTIKSLEGQIAESKVRLAETARGHRADLARRDASAAASRVALDTSVRALTARIAELEADQGAHAAIVEELRSEIDEMAGKLERSIARAHKKAQKDHVKVRRPMSPPSDPLEFATWLDTVERQQRSFRKARGTDAGLVPDRPPLRMPGGLLPDSREALSALIDLRPDVVYIDGYNVGAMLVEEVGTSKSRTSVVAIADRLAAACRARVIVVFDAVGVEGRTRAPSPGRAEVRFTHTQIADDEIVEMIQTNPSRAAVITSDRELSDRCADLGCVTVWSESLVKWARE
jgi:predicted RNA-binding protein with PIN domain